MINRGDWTFLITTPIALTIYAIAIIAVFAPCLWAMPIQRKRRHVA